MKVGIVTLHYGLNCGAILQAYALQKQIERLGYDSEFIDYRPKFTKPFRGYLAKNPTVMFNKWKDAYNELKYHWEDSFGKINRRGKVRYFSIQELRSSPPKYGIYVVGSDQLWNIAGNKSLPDAYLLDFGSKDVKRISFATSLGQGVIPDFLKQSFTNKLLNFNAISVRESNGRDVVQSLVQGSIEVKHIQDPTLMLSAEDYNKISAPIEPITNTLVSYILPQLNKEQIESLQKYVEYEKLDWINLRNPSSCMRIRYASNIIVTPELWLSYLRDSQIMVCGSFHAVMFSLIFHKPFIVVQAESVIKSGGNQRINSLLAPLELLDRCIDNLTFENIKEAINSPIDWKFVDRCMAQHKEESINFLKDNLTCH